jgi:hypothetical protein
MARPGGSNYFAATETFSFDAFGNSITLLVRSAAASGVLGVFFSGSRRAERSVQIEGRLSSRIGNERSIFDSVILDFVITTIRLLKSRR